jgi:DNA modification methylase
MNQLSLFDAVCEAYSGKEKPMVNKELYQIISEKLGLDESQFVEPVGKEQSPVNVFYRKVRWVQQSLKQEKLLIRVGRGAWELSGKEKIRLRSIKAGKRVIAMSTRLGICLWASSDNIFDELIDEPVHLLLTSPPYPLKTPRAYGNPVLSEYVDFVCRFLAPVVRKLAKGGSIALNVTNDIFEDGKPARSTYLERLVIALEDRLGLYKMDTLIWMSNKIPGPTQWACVKRQQLRTTYEPILWFTNDPEKCFSDNRRVLEPHTDKFAKFMKNGGQPAQQINGDGAYRKNKGDFGKETPGRIPTNVLDFSNNCVSGRQANQVAQEAGFAKHSAKMPCSIADFLVKFLSRPDDLVVDLFGGTMTTGEAAERNGRRWICIEKVWEYIASGFVRFSGAEDLWINPYFIDAGNTG